MGIKELRLSTLKFGHFLTKNRGLTPEKTSIFGQNINILLEASIRIIVSENVP